MEFVLSNQQEGSFIKYPFMSKNYVESLVVQIELVFRCSNVHIYLIFHKISLGLNSYVHRSAVSAPKSEDEHLSFSTSFLLLCLLFLFIGIFKTGLDTKKYTEKENKKELHELLS